MRPEDNLDYHIRSTWHSIARMYQQKALNFDATMAMGFVLLNIDREEGTPATKIAPLMGLEARSLTRILKKLEETGLIYKRKDEADGRSVRICLTVSGEIQRSIAAETVKDFNNKIRARVPASRLEIFLEVMTEVNRVVDEELNELARESKTNDIDRALSLTDRPMTVLQSHKQNQT